MPLKLLTYKTLEKFKNTEGLWFLFNDIWTGPAGVPFTEDIRQLQQFILWLEHIDTEEQDQLFEANPWIKECLDYEPRLISSLEAGISMVPKPDLETIKLIVAKLKVAGMLS